MTTSGTTSYSVTENDIITDALEDIGVVGAGQTIDPNDYAKARRKLNMLLKQWTAQIDFAPGLKMWTRRRAYLFTQADQVVYSLGPSGDECAADSYVTSTLSVAASGGAGTITLVSATGFSSAMRIGVLLSSGAFQWTTINGAPAGNVVTLTATLTGAAAAGARVFAYTSKMLRPFEIETVVRRDTDGNDSWVDRMLLDAYEAIPQKTNEGAVSCVYFEAQRTNAKLYLDCQPEDLTDVLRMVYLSYVEDMSGTTNDVDFPAEWFRALSAQLAIDCAPGFRMPIPAGLPQIATDALATARRAYPQASTAFYQSAPDSY